MLDPVIEEEESDIEAGGRLDNVEHASAGCQPRPPPAEIYKRRIARGKPTPINRHPPLSHENTRNRYHRRLISRHNTRDRKSPSATVSPVTPSWLDLSPSSSSSSSPSLPAEPPTALTPSTPLSSSPGPQRLSCPSADPKRLSEEALLHALYNIRIEEEEELHLRRRSLHIVDIPPALPDTAVPRVDISRLSAASDTPFSPKPTASLTINNPPGGVTSSSQQSEPQDSEADADVPDDPAPYANCGTYQLACSKERLRDLEQQLQDTVCMMQDAVELVARRLGGPAPTSSVPTGREGIKEKQKSVEKAEAQRVQQAVENMRNQLARMERAHERASTEHALVVGEMRSRAPEQWWEEMARVFGTAVRDGQGQA